jgi:CheY-like chemotaxis protein
LAEDSSSSGSGDPGGAPSARPLNPGGSSTAILEQRLAEAARQLEVERKERRGLEHQLLESQKIEALGRLAAGLAHDFNNQLMVISGNLDAALRQLKGEPRIMKQLVAALVAADRTAALTAKLLAFVGGRGREPEIVAVGERLEMLVRLLDRSMLGDGVEVKLVAEDALWPIRVDPDQFEAALINLAVAARDEIPGGGVITVRARNTLKIEGSASMAPLIGDFVQITAQGAGQEARGGDAIELRLMAEEAAPILNQIAAFAKHAQGAATTTGFPGRGALLSLYLPRAAADARIGAAPSFEDGVEGETRPARRGRILLVEDDADVAFAIQCLLKQTGYQVEIAAGAADALDRLKRAKPDLVLSDITMPGDMSGVNLGQEVRRRYPKLPFMLITGDPRAVTGQDFPLVTKPITGVALDLAIRQQLSAGPRAEVVPLFPEKRGGHF